MNQSFSRIVSFLIFNLAIGVLVAGCGGGGGSNTPLSGPAVDYIAEQQGGSYVGRWWYTGAVSSVAGADTYTAVAVGTNRYTATYAHNLLSSGTLGAASISGAWGPDPAPDTMYQLVPSGWIVIADTAAYLVTDGSHITITPTGGSDVAVAITKTGLAGTAIACINPSHVSMTCYGSGTYPAGSASYQLEYSYASNDFALYGDEISLPLTGDADNQLTALPTLDVTVFCLPSYLHVFKPQGAGGVYDVFSTASCSSADISTALGNPSIGTVTISNQATGNLNVQNVLLFQSTAISGFASVIDGTIIGKLSNNEVRLGWMTSAGTYQTTYMNKTAMNAQLLAVGLLELQ